MSADPVLDLITKNNLVYKISGKDYVIKCLNPEHDDNNPSFRVDRTTGISHCFSCGYKTNIFKHFGILTNTSSIKIAKLRQKMKDLIINSSGVIFPKETIPITKPFRGISAQTLKDFGAFYTLESEELTDRIFFPILDIRGKAMAYVGRHMLSDGNPRYLNYPRGVALPIYPEKLKEEKNNSLILVEGIFDLLNLYDKGLRNVVCTFGTSTLMKDTGKKLLSFKTQGITKVYIMYDGDKAGQEASNKLMPLIQEADYQVEQIILEENTDPGDLSIDEVNTIKRWLNEKNAE